MCDVGYLCANFSLPRLLCSQLRPDVCDRQTSDRQTSDVRQKHRLKPLPIRGGDIIIDKIHITGCTVAQHCYNVDVSFLREKWKLWLPVKSEPLNRLTHNLSRLSTSTRRTFLPNLIKSVHGGLVSKMVKYNFLCDFFIFFSDQRREETPGRILTHISSKDAESHRMCLLGL